MSASACAWTGQLIAERRPPPASNVSTQEDAVCCRAGSPRADGPRMRIGRYRRGGHVSVALALSTIATYGPTTSRRNVRKSRICADSTLSSRSAPFVLKGRLSNRSRLARRRGFRRCRVRVALDRLGRPVSRQCATHASERRSERSPRAGRTSWRRRPGARRGPRT